MKKNVVLIITLALLTIFVAGCGSQGGQAQNAAPPQTAVPAPGAQPPAGGANTASPEQKNLKIAFLVDRLGDNSTSDAFHSGVLRYEAETGNEVMVLEHPELQDYAINVRSLCEDGYGLIIYPFATAAELILPLAEEFPDTWFYIQNTPSDLPNVVSIRFMGNEAAFLTGAFSVLMNQEFGGEPKSAFVGGMQNPVLERAQFSFEAGSRYAGGEPTSVYIGSYTDIAKGKEISLQLYQSGIHVIQAYAGGAGTGVFQAAESLGGNYYAMGEADGQFGVSDRILASMVSKMGDMVYGVIQDYLNGDLEAGLKDAGYTEGIVSIEYAPGKEDLIPQSVKDKIKELEEKVISKEIMPPQTKEEYDAFAEEYLK
jgi:basic membrane protein A